MTSKEPGQQQLDELGLPWDLTEWIDQEELLETLGRQLETIDWTDPKLVAFEQKYPQFRPKMLLTLLSYAYSTGLYASQDISDACYSDEKLRAICGGEPPSPRDIMAFRRENRGLLQWLLSELFKQALKRKFEMGDFLLPAGLKRSLADAATARLDIARHIDRGASEE